MTDKKEGTKSKEGSRSNSPTKQRAGAESKQSNHSNQKDKNYFQSKLERLQEDLQREKSRIKKPKQQKHVPWTFNALDPYFDSTLAESVIDKDAEQPSGYQNRQTAPGLCDPWVSHKMDQGTAKLSQSKPASPAPDHDDSRHKKSDKKKTGTKKTKEGSTRLPKFPAVSVPASDLTTKTLYYSDVPMLRKQIREKYGANAGAKVDGEYTRTKQDYYRMDLDKIEDYHPINRDHMRQTYFAYLQNNAGSKKAIYECVRESQKDETENDSHSHTGSRPGSSRSYHSRPQSSRSRQSIKGS